MKGTGRNTIGAGVATQEKADDGTEKRSREREEAISQQAGQASGTEDRPLKTRKVMSPAADENNDPVALARRALEMFRQEVEEDGDYIEPDTTPGEIEATATTSSQKMMVPPPPPRTSATRKEPTAVSLKTTTSATQDSRLQKAWRQPMIIAHEDDPSIL